MNNNITQRDAFWKKVYEQAQTNKDIVVISADMGAPSLDAFRRDMPSQFINVGIAEQQAISLAAGLAFEGKHPFVYAIAPFITLRCLEQIRVSCSIMNIPITVVGIGVGFGYDDSGPTHHLLEDIAVMRVFPNIIINSISDSTMAAEVACRSLHYTSTNYVRLDRHLTPSLYSEGHKFTADYEILKDDPNNLILATGSAVHIALNVAQIIQKKYHKKIGVVDVHTIPVSSKFLELLSKAKQIITLEEHFLSGGFGSYILEVVNENQLDTRVSRFGLSHSTGYSYVYGGLEQIRKHYRIDANNIAEMIVKKKLID